MLRRLARRLWAPAPASPPAQPPARSTSAAPVDFPQSRPPARLPAGPAADSHTSGGIVLVDLPGLLAGVQPRGRPIVVHHWASWDEASTGGLPAIAALSQTVDVVGVAWDEFAPAPLGRIAAMAQRPARWAAGAQVEAWVRQVGIDWPILVFGGEPEALFEAFGLVDRWVPQLTLYGPDGNVLAHHGGPPSGESWDRFVADVDRFVGYNRLFGDRGLRPP